MNDVRQDTEFDDNTNALWPNTPVGCDHAVILAAGSGSRFAASSNGRPKPLLEVSGVPLIVRTIQTAKKAGIHHFTIITGYQAESIESFITQGFFPETEIHCVRNEDWQRPNGISALKAQGIVKDPFILLMSDHLFDAAILRKLMENPLPPGHCRLAVDFAPECVFDLEDATKVQVIDGGIQEIGKKIEAYNAIDTGIFLCQHHLFDALQVSISKGNETLSDGIREIARKGQMEAKGIDGLFWQDVDNQKDLKEGESRLLESLGSKTDSWLTRLINRKISLAITRRLAHTQIRPNQITLFNFALGLLAAGCMLLGTYPGFLVGSICFLLSSILDGCDGEIARLKFQESRFGAWLDVVTDNITHLLLFVCLTVGLIRASGSWNYLTAGTLLLAGALASLYLFIMGRRQEKRGGGLLFSEQRLQDITEDKIKSQLSKWLDRFANRDFAYLLLFLALIDRVGWFLWIAGIGAPVFACLFYRTLKNGRKISPVSATGEAV
jgi:CDP-L-myo-inositol myo-inositolphosphotransferase